MKVREMTSEEAFYWINRVKALQENGMTKVQWCAIGRELIEKHGLSQRVAVRLMHGDIEDAIKIEREEECEK